MVFPIRLEVQTQQWAGGTAVGVCISPKRAHAVPSVLSS